MLFARTKDLLLFKLMSSDLFCRARQIIDSPSLLFHAQKLNIAEFSASHFRIYQSGNYCFHRLVCIVGCLFKRFARCQKSFQCWKSFFIEKWTFLTVFGGYVVHKFWKPHVRSTKSIYIKFSCNSKKVFWKEVLHTIKQRQNDGHVTLKWRK